jgi:hypothetical protein
VNSAEWYITMTFMTYTVHVVTGVAKYRSLRWTRWLGWGTVLMRMWEDNIKMVMRIEGEWN